MKSSKGFIQHQIHNASDLTTDEKVTALEDLEMLDESSIKTVLFESLKDIYDLSEAAGDDDVAGYFKHRNKLRKITGQKADPNTPKYTAVKKGTGKAAGTGKKMSWGKKIMAKIKAAKGALYKKAAGNPKIMKAAKAAAKLASN